jgi:hypothetical protein
VEPAALEAPEKTAARAEMELVVQMAATARMAPPARMGLTEPTVKMVKKARMGQTVPKGRMAEMVETAVLDTQWEKILNW